MIGQHLKRADITLPCVFDAQDQVTRRALVDIQSYAAFKYFLPKLNALETEDILELRIKLKDTREGFTMHLQKLSKSMDGLIKGGAKLPELSKEAQALIETELVPDYREFRRQVSKQKKQANGKKRLM